MARAQLNERIGIRMSTAEARMLEELSTRTGLNMSNVVRQLIRREHAATAPPMRAPAPKRKAKR